MDHDGSDVYVRAELIVAPTLRPHSLGDVARGIPLSMSRMKSESLNPEPFSRSLAANVLVREEPDDEEDEEDDGKEEDDEDEEDDEGYSE